MPCNVFRDKHGSMWRVESFNPTDMTANTPSPHVDVWWNRDTKNRSDELLMIRQQNNDDRADVISVNLGQLYDLLHALACAVTTS